MQRLLSQGQFRRFAFALIGAALLVGWTARVNAQGRGSSDASLTDAGKQISFELVLIDRGPDQLAGETGKHPTAAQILELEKQGKLGSVQRLKLVALENVEARLMLGESAPMVTSRMVRGGGTREGGFGGGSFPGTESVTYTELGTQVSITAKVDKDGSVVASFNVQRTTFAPTKAAEKPEAQDALPVQPRKLVSGVTTAARIAEGETIVLGGQQTLTGATPGELWVLVTAKTQ